MGKINKSIIAKNYSSIKNAKTGIDLKYTKINFFISGFIVGIISSLIATYIWNLLIK